MRVGIRTGYVVAAAALEGVALFALLVCWVGTLWNMSIPSNASAYSAQAAAPLDSSAETTLLIMAAALGLVLLVGVGAAVARRPIFAVVQLVLLIGMLVIFRQDAIWAWHVTHPLPAPPTLSPTYQPCYSGSNTCN